MHKNPADVSAGISRKQRLSSECGPMRPPGCEMNQGQGQVKDCQPDLCT